ncbi:MAG: DUF362 domain-containing protein [Candidatus Aminicenantes bacterium]|nr:DUF362 domain-containing protein [Candidatus Aminicenantes bacterium]NIM82093.1 DUF362 domain-containing protein [Candidatus Aminicenantes bacterium]NIN21487.1 DUF362 domain-containing protein [Candidatus Aminicenantes bacterium]NIN45299.1 DUF362 domain-containing protein [Candidatus Aminicenantes bacterium]NIN88116.1 DUF362 domain-containing protein [Candidatus Aminicenantes bacterium]
MSEKLTRRDFIKSGSRAIAVLGAAAGAFPFIKGTLAASAAGKSKVIAARNERAINSRNVCNQKEVTLMFDRALSALTGKDDSVKAWDSLGLRENDVVAIKVNCNTWTIRLSPHWELVHALCESLKRVIPLNQVIIYERTTSDLEQGGFKANKSMTGVRYFGNDDGGGYHPRERLTRIVTDTATKIINLASLKCVDGGFGVSLFFKNHIGSLRDRDMSKCHGDLDFLAEVSARPSIRDKTILNLCDALRGTYRRGVPWYWSGIVMGRDPVAAEYAAIQVMNEKRKQERVSLLEIPSHLEIAERKYRLGTCNPGKIDLRRI